MFNIATINYFKAMIEPAVELELTDLNTPGIKPDADTNTNGELSAVVAYNVPGIPTYKPPAKNGISYG
jgi:hypothetical protein